MVVDDVVRESADVVSVIISGRNLDSLHAQAGQFFRWRFLTRGQWQAAHPYSLSLPPAPNKMRITVAAAGRHSRRIAALHPGTRVVAEGPCGGFTAARRRRANVLLIAGGIGITPLRALYESLTPTDGVIRLLYRASTEQDVLFRNELAAIAETDGKELTVLVGRRAQLGYDPLAISRLCTLVPELFYCDVFLCGPRGMAVTIRDQLRTAEFDCRHLFTESFGL
jgi:ferredoxin-NADP reductase